ncbi:uncharacterized protein [Palaemon carinicauda]|uniref:uncharacterized protein n=1 Tax=Palaemon carinicauda TaxID=392227 RepID=UPI0035B671D9
MSPIDDWSTQTCTCRHLLNPPPPALLFTSEHPRMSTPIYSRHTRKFSVQNFAKCPRLVPSTHTLKATLMSCCKDINWFTQLTWFLMGIRTTPKDAQDVSTAEIVYGNPLVVPAILFPSATSSDDLQHIRHVVGKFTPCHQTFKPPVKHHIPTDLHSATHVFLRHDTIKTLLRLPYTGPILVIQRSSEAFLLNIRGKEDWVSIDHLKPPYLLPDDLPIVRFSRSGRTN